MLDSLSPARRRFMLLAAVLGVLVVAVVPVTAYVRTRPPQVTPVSQARPGPVLLVPGYGGSTASLEVLATALRDAGRDARIIAPKDGGTNDLVAQAADLGHAVDQVLGQTGAPSVDVVGYSAGGVIVRIWVADLGGGNQARRVITLSSPQHGTDLAALAGDLAPGACPMACGQLAPDSDLLSRLNNGDETPPGPRWVSIWTIDDKTVVPPDSASLEGALDFSVQSVCPDVQVGHPDVPRTPVVMAMVEQLLGTAEPQVPADRVCRAG